MPINSGRRLPRGVVVLLVTLLSGALGWAYYAYLLSVPFPPTVARIVPFVWLAGALAGLILGVRATISSRSRSCLGVASLVLSLPNVWFAALYTMAAAFGG